MGQNVAFKIQFKQLAKPNPPICLAWGFCEFFVWLGFLVWLVWVLFLFSKVLIKSRCACQVTLLAQNPRMNKHLPEVPLGFHLQSFSGPIGCWQKQTPCKTHLWQHYPPCTLPFLCKVGWILFSALHGQVSHLLTTIGSYSGRQNEDGGMIFYSSPLKQSQYEKLAQISLDHSVNNIKYNYD